MADTIPRRFLVLEEFFSGPVVAEGFFLNSWSRSRRGIVIDIVPAWDGSVLSLDERFVYSDGETEHKVWRLARTAPGTFAGEREDMVGTARIWTEDGVVRLSYVLKLLDIGFNFDETMILREDGTLLGRSTVKKWGILIGRVELTMRRV